MRSLQSVAQAHSVRRAASEPSSGDEDEDEGAAHGDAPSAAAEAAASGTLSSDDLARTLYDLLAALPAPPPDDADLLTASWCGAAEFGLVVPATEGLAPRQRKRQRTEQQHEAGQGADLRASAKWASARLHRRAYRCVCRVCGGGGSGLAQWRACNTLRGPPRARSDAWLALLRVKLPEDIYKKVRAAGERVGVVQVCERHSLPSVPFPCSCWRACTTWSSLRCSTRCSSPTF